MDNGNEMEHQIDLWETQRRKEEGMDNVEGGSSIIWGKFADEAVYQAALHNRHFIVDKVWEYMSPGAPSTNDNRAMGPVMSRAAKKGLITATNRLEPGRQIKSHGNPRRLWQSLICSEA